jgi:protein-L-isoaspartate(D-aspartate) O-methyltransferase
VIRKVDGVDIGDNKGELVQIIGRVFLAEYGIQLSDQVRNALFAVDRKRFLESIEMDPSLVIEFAKLGTFYPKDLAYYDKPVPIGYGQTCSQPSLVAYMAKVLELKQGMNVLEIGAGCLYAATIFAECVGHGTVVAIEGEKKLVDLAQRNNAMHFRGNTQRVHVHHGDGRLGFPERAPYDRIVFSAGVEDIEVFDRSVLEAQLQPNGMMLIPERVGGLYLFEYQGDRLLNRSRLCDVTFVPLL